MQNAEFGPYFSESNITLPHYSSGSVTGDIMPISCENTSLFSNLQAFWNM